MKISKLLSEALIEPNLVAADKTAVLERLVDLAAACVMADCQADKPQVLAALQAREEVTSTGIGCGVAIPHAKEEDISEDVQVEAGRAGSAGRADLPSGRHPERGERGKDNHGAGHRGHGNQEASVAACNISEQYMAESARAPESTVHVHFHVTLLSLGRR